MIIKKQLYHLLYPSLNCSSILGLGLETAVTFFGNGQLDALTARQRHNGLGIASLTNDENVSKTGYESLTQGILDVYDIIATRVTLSGHNVAHTASVTTTGGHDHHARLKLDKVINAAGLEVDLDGIVDADDRISVRDGAAVVAYHIGDTALAAGLLGDLGQLELSLLRLDSMDGKLALGVKDEAEVLVGLGDRHNVHVPSRVVDVSAHTAIDHNLTLLHDHLCLMVVESVFQTVAQENDEGHALAHLVGAARGTGSVNSGKLIKQPVLGSCETLQMLFGTTSHI